MRQNDKIEPLKDLLGIITVLNTPFTESNLIDEASLRRNVRYALEAGVVGILFPAMASEVYNLSIEERLWAANIIIEELKGRAVFIGGTAARSDKERISIAREMINLGCDGILVNIPFENKRDYKKAVERIASLEPKFLMIQDWDFKGYGLPVSLIAELFRNIEVFKCLKVEVVPAGKKYTEVLMATKGKLHVSGGWAVMQMLEALDRGVHAFMPTGMHKVYTRIFNLYRTGNREEAKTLFHKILPVLAFSNQHLDISIHFFKHLLYRQGIYSTPGVREPIADFDSYHAKIANELIDYFIQLEAALS